jgi:hypothetical protein
VDVVLLEDTGVGQEGAEVTTWDVFLDDVDALCVLEDVEEKGES